MVLRLYRQIITFVQQSTICMYETVSVDEAVRKGRRIINLPILFIMFVPPALLFFAVAFYDYPGWTIIVAVSVGFISAWVFWSFMITKWRLWAFDNVRNVHELRKRAIKEKLIWPDGTFFEKTEIRTSSDKERWVSLQERFNREDVFIDDYTIPTLTEIYFSKNKKIGNMIALLLCLTGGVFLLIATDRYLVGSIACLGSIIFFLIDLKACLKIDE